MAAEAAAVAEVGVRPVRDPISLFDDSDGSATDEDEHDDDDDDGEAGPTAEEVRTFIAGMLEAAGA